MDGGGVNVAVGARVAVLVKSTSRQAGQESSAPAAWRV
jgi:hypothetical protein